MKYVKLLIMGLLGVLIPFMILIPIFEYHGNDILNCIAVLIFYTYPLYLPVFCGFYGARLFKVTKIVFIPTLLYNIFLFFSTFILSQVAAEATMNGNAGDLGASLIVLVLLLPTLYSIPISFIVGLICKHKKKKAEMLNNEKTTANN